MAQSPPKQPGAHQVARRFGETGNGMRLSPQVPSNGDPPCLPQTQALNLQQWGSWTFLPVTLGARVTLSLPAQPTGRCECFPEPAAGSSYRGGQVDFVLLEGAAGSRSRAEGNPPVHFQRASAQGQHLPPRPLRSAPELPLGAIQTGEPRASPLDQWGR